MASSSGLRRAYPVLSPPVTNWRGPWAFLLASCVPSSQTQFLGLTSAFQLGQNESQEGSGVPPNHLRQQERDKKDGLLRVLGYTLLYVHLPVKEII